MPEETFLGGNKQHVAASFLLNTNIFSSEDYLMGVGENAKNFTAPIVAMSPKFKFRK